MKGGWVRSNIRVQWMGCNALLTNCKRLGKCAGRSLCRHFLFTRPRKFPLQEAPIVIVMASGHHHHHHHHQIATEIQGKGIELQCMQRQN